MNDLSPQSNREVQEALSLRYVVAAIVTPLDNGQFAVFANDRSLDSLIICSSEDLPIVIASRAKMNPRKTSPQSQPIQLAPVDLSDLLGNP